MTIVIKKEDIKKLRMDLKKYGCKLKTQSLNETKYFIFVSKDNTEIVGLFNVMPSDIYDKYIDIIELCKLYKC